MITTYNGGFYDYPDKSVSNVFREGSCTTSKAATIKSGQVIKALSFLESDSTGKLIAHTGVNEIATITFPTKVDTGETVIIAGLTFTAGSASTTTQAQLVAAWKNIPAGTTAAAANTLKGTAVSAVIGTFTAGTLTGYDTDTSSTAGSVTFISTTPNAGVSDLTVTGTGDASSVTITALNDPMKPIAGVTIYDVDASAGDFNAEVYIEASFYADKLVWSADVDTDTITLPDGTTKAVTFYNTGCTGSTTAATKLLRQKFVEGSEFELAFIKTGEVANG
jgi:hypothetical protein